MKKMVVKFVSLGFLIIIGGGLSACQSMPNVDSSSRAEAPQYKDAQVEKAEEPKSTPIHEMAEQYGDAPIAGVMPSRLVWNDWQDEISAASRIDTAGDTSSVPAPMFQSFNQASGNGRHMKINDSVTVYPLDGSFSEYEPVRQGDFWEYMTVDSQGVTVERMGPESAASSTYKGSGEPVIYFNHGSSRLSPADKKKIKTIVNDTKNRNNYLIRVTGYASRPVLNASTEIERQIINLKMGSKRAIAVSSELLQSGIPAANIQTITRGAAFAKDDDPADRRATIEILNR